MYESPPPSCFASLIALHAARHPNRVAMVDRGRPLSYADLEAQSRSLAVGLATLGVRQDDRIAVWLPNSHAWLLTFLACARLGAVVFAVNTRFRAQEVEDIVGRGRVDWLVLWPDFKGIAFSEILDGVTDACVARLKGIVCYSEQADSFAPRTLRGRPAHGFADLLTADASSVSPMDGSLSERGALVFTTSGTTSLPKFVLHRQRTLIEHGWAVSQAFGYDDSTCVLASTPFCGAFGFATLLGAMVQGATIVGEPVFAPAQAMRMVHEYRVTHTFANNESISAMIDASTSPQDFASVRFFGFSSFSPALDGLVERAAGRGLALAGLYGSSELNALVAAQPIATDASDPRLQFLPGGRLAHPEARVRARDTEQGRVLPHGEAGDLEIFSPCAMAGYLDQPKATAEAFTEDGYFRTGDLGFTVDDRQFIFQSRMGDSLRLSGFLVNPAEIEAVIDTLPGIAASQVVGASDGKHAVAFVLLAPGARVDETAWAVLCKKRMAGFKVPARFVVLDEFPTVASANAVKIQRGRLRELANQFLTAQQPAAM